RAMSRQTVADCIQARFGSRSYAAGLQLRDESFSDLGFSSNRIVIVVRSGGLLGIRNRNGGQEEKKLHRNSVRLKGFHCVLCRARFRACQNPNPNSRSCRIASCERDRLLSKGLGSSNRKIPWTYRCLPSSCSFLGLAPAVRRKIPSTTEIGPR